MDGKWDSSVRFEAGEWNFLDLFRKPILATGWRKVTGNLKAGR